MCTTIIYEDVNGRRIIDGNRPSLCPDSRYGKPCGAATVKIERRAPRHMPSSPTAPAAPPVTSYPPSSRHEPRVSSRASSSSRPESRVSSRASSSSYGDGHSRHSSTASSVHSQLSPDLYITISQGVYGINSGRERTMATPRTVPPLPSTNIPATYSGSPREHRSRPYHVDERPRAPPPPPPPQPQPQPQQVPSYTFSPLLSSKSSSPHSRQASSSSRSSRPSSASYDAEELRRREEYDGRKSHALRQRVGRANSNISSRRDSSPEQQRQQKPQPMQPVVERHEDGLGDAMSRLAVKDENWTARKAHQRGLQHEREEREAQNRRLEERLPSHRASVGPGSRRHRIAYDTGLYRFE